MERSVKNVCCAPFFSGSATAFPFSSIPISNASGACCLDAVKVNNLLANCSHSTAQHSTAQHSTAQHSTNCVNLFISDKKSRFFLSMESWIFLYFKHAAKSRNRLSRLSVFGQRKSRNFYNEVTSKYRIFYREEEKGKVSYPKENLFFLILILLWQESITGNDSQM